MFLWYRGIPAQILQTNYVGREPVYTEDGQDMIYQKWRVDVLMRINPSAMSYVASDSGVEAPKFKLGTNPAVTDSQLRQHFMTPSGRISLLFMAAGAVTATLFDTPLPPYTCDARGGPYPRQFDIIRIHADKTLDVRYVIETYNRAEFYILPGETKSAIIAHRWRQWMDVDDDYFAVRVTQGVAHFDLSQLVRDEVSPDQFRQDLPFPIPVGWKRDNIRVEQSMDGTALHYSFEERELPMNFGPMVRPGVTRCEAYLTEGSTVPSTTQAAYDLLNKTLISAVSHLGAAAAQAARNPIKAPLTATASGIEFTTQSAINVLESAQSMLPTFYKHILVRVWGSKTSKKADLTDFALGIAYAKLSTFFSFFNVPTKDVKITWDLMGKFVELDWTWKFGPNPVTWIQAFSMFGDFTGSDDVTSIETGRNLLQNAASVAPVPPNSNGSRGTSLVAILAQALTAPGQIPVSPPKGKDNENEDFFPDWQQQSPIKAAPYPPNQPDAPVNQELLPIRGGDITYPPGPPAGTPATDTSKLKATKPWNPDPRYSASN